jgi:peptidoglycan/xylan/chitin deacetylase (PgdA/CDA1 family)
VLGVFAPVSLLAASGCGTSGTASSATGAPSPSGPPSSSSAASPVARTGSAAGSAGPAGSPSPTAPATPEVSRAPGAIDAVALTFHGDGTPALADALLTEAEQHGAHLTVLAVGQWLAKHPEMAERVLNGGHELGNHTEHHLAIDRMSAETAFSEIDRCAQRLEKLTGTRGRWFRQSQGQHASATVRAAATRAGYGTLLSYDLDPLDYRDPGATAITRNVLTKVRPGDVVSLHLGHPETVTALPTILEGLRTRGLRAVTASELFPLDGGAPTSPADGSSASQPSQIS